MSMEAKNTNINGARDCFLVSQYLENIFDTDSKYIGIIIIRTKQQAMLSAGSDRNPPNQKFELKKSTVIDIFRRH